MIVIDPGHGGRDPGAVGPTGLRERDVVWEWAKSCRFLLRVAGFDVEYTHQRDWGAWKRLKYPNSWRPRRANSLGAAMICLHLNAAENPAADYTLVLHNGSDAAADWAVELSHQLAAITGNSQVTVKPMHLGDRGAGLILPVVKPAVLLEPAFISNRTREAWLRDHDHIVGMARAVVTATLARLPT